MPDPLLQPAAFVTVLVSGTPGGDGREVVLRVTATDIEWQRVGDPTWQTLVPLSTIKGDPGDEVELGTTATHIVWRLTGGTWANLVPLASLATTADAGLTTVVDPNVAPAVTNVGTVQDAVFAFTLPRAPQVNVSGTTPALPNVAPSVTGGATAAGDTTLEFVLPRAAQVTIGTVSTVAPDVPASVADSGTNGDVVLDFGIPKGDTGLTGTVTGAVAPEDTDQLWVDTTDDTPNDSVVFDPTIGVGDLVVVKSIDPPVVEGSPHDYVKTLDSPYILPDLVAWSDFRRLPDAGIASRPVSLDSGQLLEYGEAGTSIRWGINRGGLTNVGDLGAIAVAFDIQTIPLTALEFKVAVGSKNSSVNRYHRLDFCLSDDRTAFLRISFYDGTVRLYEYFDGSASILAQAGRVGYASSIIHVLYQPTVMRVTVFQDGVFLYSLNHTYSIQPSSIMRLWSRESWTRFEAIAVGAR